VDNTVLKLCGVIDWGWLWLLMALSIGLGRSRKLEGSGLYARNVSKRWAAAATSPPPLTSTD